MDLRVVLQQMLADEHGRAQRAVVNVLRNQVNLLVTGQLVLPVESLRAALALVLLGVRVDRQHVPVEVALFEERAAADAARKVLHRRHRQAWIHLRHVRPRQKLVHDRIFLLWLDHLLLHVVRDALRVEVHRRCRRCTLLVVEHNRLWRNLHLHRRIEVRLQVDVQLVALRKCLIAVLAEHRLAVHVDLQVPRQLRVRVKRFRAQRALEGLRVLRVRPLVFGEVCVARERLLADVAAVQANA